MLRQEGLLQRLPGQEGVAYHIVEEEAFKAARRGGEPVGEAQLSCDIEEELI